MKLRPLAELLQQELQSPNPPREVLALTTDQYQNQRWLVIHYAQGGGDDQPPFRGWFYWAGAWSELDEKWIKGWIDIPEIEGAP